MAVIEGLHKEIMAAPVPVVFDHFGGAKASLGTGQAGFDTMLGLVRSGKAYVKISGAYRSSDKAPDYPDVAPLLQIDDGRLLNQLAVWAPDAGVRKKILVDNPARLYGF